MPENRYENTPLPWLDPSLDREFKRNTGMSATVKMSEYHDRLTMLVAKSKGLSTSAYMKAAINEQLDKDLEVLKGTVDPLTLQKTMAQMLGKRAATSILRQQTAAKNKAAANNEAIAE